MILFVFAERREGKVAPALLLRTAGDSRSVTSLASAAKFRNIREMAALSTQGQTVGKWDYWVGFPCEDEVVADLKRFSPGFAIFLPNAVWSVSA